MYLTASLVYDPDQHDIAPEESLDADEDRRHRDTRRLAVRSLDPGVTDDLLRDFASQAGEVVFAKAHAYAEGEG